MRFISTLFVVVFVCVAQMVTAQNLFNMNFQQINVDNLSDQQIQQIYQQAQSSGFSISDITSLAMARGMSQTEATKLRRRLQQVASGAVTADRRRALDSRLRFNPVDTTRGGFLPFGGPDTLGRFSELDYLMTPEARVYRARRDSIRLQQIKLEDKIYGYDLFRAGPAGFEPALNIPTPKNYQLGPGDEVIIDIWGAAANTYQLEIAPDGIVLIENIGPVYLNGLTIEEATNRLRSKLSEIYSGLSAETPSERDTFMQVSLGQVRSIKVTVLGEAKQPGTYTLPSLATIFNALYSAGGPSVKGSFRNIQLLRNDQIVSTFDIYNFLVEGDQSGNIRLQDQDIIRITPYLNRVEVTGEIKRDGLYELKEGETMQDLIAYAGGFTGKAYSDLIKVQGNTGKQRYVKDIPRRQFGTYELKNGDMVRVGKILNRYENMVEISGAVFRPGRYQLTDTSSVYNLIQRADGLKGDAFMNRGLLVRTKDNLTLEAISFNVRELINNPEQHDIPLRRNDVVNISSIFDLRENFYVEIEGSVQNPQQIRFVENMTLEDLIYQAGGFKINAAPYRIEVARRIRDVEEGMGTSQIAEVFQFSVDEDLTLDPKESSFKLQPFDKVYVRSAPNYEIQQDVKVGGQVRFPGSYSLRNRNERISDLIERAGGLTEDAYVEGAALYRILEQTGGDNQTAQPQSFIELDEADTTLQRSRTLSKIGINLPRVLSRPGSAYDLLLETGDSLYIPKELQTVVVKGGVFYPTTIRYDDGRSYRDYISSAGGFNDLARKKSAYIVYANGDVDRTKKFLFFKNYPEVRPGATLVVPQRERARRLTPQETVSLFSAIVSTAALITTTILQVRRQ